jgi:glycosyltransferase involved in cell wall biosynthesis
MKLTVLMPVYNGGERTKSAIKSILRQTYKDFEFLIVDDGSTDNTEEIISLFKDLRINYKKIEHSGISKALNFGINNASGDYIARMDSDDISLLNRLELQIAEFEKDTSISVLSNWYAHMNSDHKVFRIVKTPLENTKIKKELLFHSVICHASSIMKKSDIMKIGLYNPEYDGLEDYELWLRGLNELKLPAINPKYLFRYLYSYAPQFIYNRKIDLWLYWKMLTLKTMFSGERSKIDKEIKEIILN